MNQNDPGNLELVSRTDRPRIARRSRSTNGCRVLDPTPMLEVIRGFEESAPAAKPTVAILDGENHLVWTSSLERGWRAVCTFRSGHGARRTKDSVLANSDHDDGQLIASFSVAEAQVLICAATELGRAASETQGYPLTAAVSIEAMKQLHVLAKACETQFRRCSKIMDNAAPALLGIEGWVREDAQINLDRLRVAAVGVENVVNQRSSLLVVESLGVAIEGLASFIDAAAVSSLAKALASENVCAQPHTAGKFMGQLATLSSSLRVCAFQEFERLSKQIALAKKADQSLSTLTRQMIYSVDPMINNEK
jgi:hypothetical protein